MSDRYPGFPRTADALGVLDNLGRRDNLGAVGDYGFLLDLGIYGASAVPEFLLLENGDKLLQENGDFILLQ